MQPFEGNGYTAAAVVAALKGPRYQFFTYEIERPIYPPPGPGQYPWTQIGPLTSVKSCTLKWDRTQKVHRTAQLTFTDGLADSPAINYLTDAVRVFWSVRMPDGGYRTWCMGHFNLTAPEIPYTSDKHVQIGSGTVLPISARKVDGYDAMQLLTERKSTGWVTRAAGENAVGTVVNLLQQEFPPWNVYIPPSDVLLDKAKVYPVGTPLIDQVNDLLQFANYHPIRADIFGAFHSEAYVRPSQRTSEFTYTDDTASIIVRDSTKLKLDVFDAPNRFKRYTSNSDPAKSLVSDQIDLTDPANWLSIPARGGRIIADIQSTDAPNLTVLNQKVRDAAEQAQLRHGQMEWETPLMPHGHETVVTFHHAGLTAGDQDKLWIERSWTFECEPDGKMTHVFEKVAEAIA
jgi:hypothetical protein